MKFKSFTAGVLFSLMSLYASAQHIRVDAIFNDKRNIRLDVVTPIKKLKSDLFMTLENNVSRVRYNFMPLQKGNWHYGVGGHYFNLKEGDFGPTITYLETKKEVKVMSQTNLYLLNQKVFNKTHVNYKNLEFEILFKYENNENYLIRPGLTYWIKNNVYKAGIGIEALILKKDGEQINTIGLRGSFKIEGKK